MGPMRRAPLALLGTLAASLACGALPSGATVKHCYEVVDGAERTLVVIEDGSPQASVTILDADGGNPQKTLGRLEAGAFVYADGTRLHFDAESVRGSAGSLLDGVVGKACPCP
jgi:hypothetical protein